MRLPTAEASLDDEGGTENFIGYAEHARRPTSLNDNFFSQDEREQYETNLKAMQKHAEEYLKEAYSRQAYPTFDPADLIELCRPPVGLKKTIQWPEKIGQIKGCALVSAEKGVDLTSIAVRLGYESSKMVFRINHTDMQRLWKGVDQNPFQALETGMVHENMAHTLVMTDVETLGVENLLHIKDLPPARLWAQLCNYAKHNNFNQHLSLLFTSTRPQIIPRDLISQIGTFLHVHKGTMEMSSEPEWL